MCATCNGTGRVKVKVGFHYKNNQDPIFALKVDYEMRPCPDCRMTSKEGGADVD